MAMVTICSDFGAQENKVCHCFHCFQLTLHVMHSAHRLNKQDDNIQPWCTAFPICKQSIVPSLVLTVASWPAYKFCRRQVRWLWYSLLFKNFPQFVVIHTVKDLGIVNKAEVDVFLEFSCFFYDPMDVGNLISDSYAFSQSWLNIWEFSVHILLKSSLENLEHYFASMWNECNCTVFWTFFTLPFFGIGIKTGLFQSCGHC